VGHQGIARAEDHGRADDRPAQVRGAFLANDSLALAFGPQVSARSVVGVRIECAHVQKPVDPLLAASGHELADEVLVDAPELGAAPAAIPRGADQVDDGIMAGNRPA